MKLRIPPGCGAASHAGDMLAIDAEGCVTVEEEAARALRAHGFVLLSADEERSNAAPRTRSADAQSEKHDPPGDEIDRLNRRGLFAFLKVKGIGVSLPVTNDELRVLARRAIESAPCDPPDEIEEAQ